MPRTCDDTSRLGRWALALLVSTIACACSGSRSPTDSTQLYTGTWEGTITSDAIGAPGSMTLDVATERTAATLVLVSGTWRTSFAATTFDGSGEFSGSGRTSSTALALIFSASKVPCPDAFGGIAQKTMAATVTAIGGRMTGRYVAPGCPGGAIDLTKR
jgi:hypothetical protein